MRGLLAWRVFKNQAPPAPYGIGDFTNDIRNYLSGTPTLSGTRVNEETAMRFITVFSCVRVLAETLGSLPCQVYRENTSGKRDKVRDHRVWHLLHNNPNDEMTSQTWIETLMGHVASSGNCYSILTPNGRGEVMDAYPLDWHTITPRRNKETERLEYALKQEGGKEELFQPERVLHIPGLGFDGLRGYSPIAMAREAIGLGLAATEFAAKFYSQGVNVSGVLVHPGELSLEAQDRLRASFETRSSGMANIHRPLVLEEGMKWERASMPLEDAQLLETRKFTRDELCGLFRVPPHMIANLEKATFSNVEHLSLEFVKYTMLPWITRFERAMTWKLFTRQEREQGFYIKFNVEGLLRGDYLSRQQGLHLMRQDGVINADEWRALEEWNPIPDGSGQHYLVNGNMISADTAAMQQPKNTGSTGNSGGD
jgi:HK97 family phage portal protein